MTRAKRYITGKDSKSAAVNQRQVLDFLHEGKPFRHIREGYKRSCRDADISYGLFVEGGFT